MAIFKMKEVMLGRDIGEAAADAILVAKAASDEAVIQFDFNEITLSVTAKDTVGDVCAQYDRLSAERREKYYASDEYKARCKMEDEAARLRPIQFREKVAVMSTMTEMQLRECECPWPHDMEELTLLISTLEKRQHDYGTCICAMSLAACATFRYLCHQFGASGFQTSCADLDFLARTRLLKGPFAIVKAEDMLYPQFSSKGDELAEKWKPWLKEEAKKKIASHGDVACTSVLSHWNKLAAE